MKEIYRNDNYAVVEKKRHMRSGCAENPQLCRQSENEKLALFKK